MVRGRLTTWTCFCERTNDADTEVCPACGRQRDFVLQKQAEEDAASGTDAVWQCPCGQENPQDVEMCPACGRQRDFVLSVQAQDSTSGADGSGNEGTRAVTRQPRRLPRLPVGALQSVSWPQWRERHPSLAKVLVTLVLLVLIYWATIIIVDYVTQPNLVMTTSPLVGGIAVQAALAQKGEIAAQVTYTGSVLPWQEVQVFPRVQGWLQQFDLYEGDVVKKGDVIARLDRAELRAMVDRNRAAASEAGQQRGVLQEKVTALEAVLSAAQAGKAEAVANLAFWNKEHQRVKQLFQEGAVAEFDLDSATRQHLAARAKVAEQEGKIKQQEANLAEMQARFKQVGSMIGKARAELQRSRTVYGYTDIVAPISGHVATRHVYAGVLVKPGMPLVTIQDLHQVRVQVRVAEQDMSHVAAGTLAVVRFPSLPAPHNILNATVSTIFPQLDPVTRTLTVEMVIDNPDNRIQAEMYVVVDIILHHKPEALLIPRQAVIQVGGKPTVFTVDGSYAKANEVTLGIASGEQVEVVAGLNEGELVVFKGNRGLVDGQEVNLVGGF